MEGGLVPRIGDQKKNTNWVSYLNNAKSETGSTAKIYHSKPTTPRPVSADQGYNTQTRHPEVEEQLGHEDWQKILGGIPTKESIERLTSMFTATLLDTNKNPEDVKAAIRARFSKES